MDECYNLIREVNDRLILPEDELRDACVEAAEKYLTAEIKLSISQGETDRTEKVTVDYNCGKDGYFSYKYRNEIYLNLNSLVLEIIGGKL
jgi:membrane-bound inhibitor of C-type lysozyme